MSKRDHHAKASEVFANTEFVFSRKARFAEAFAEIETLRVTATETGDVGYGHERKHYMSQENAGEYMDCSNSVCYNGGISIGQYIRQMVPERKTQMEFDGICQGNEGSPKGRRIYRKCLNHFKGTIEITYHEPPVAKPEASE